MSKQQKEDWKFYRAYANIPIVLRSEICCVVDNEPMTFSIVKLELDNKTEIGFKAVDQMLQLGIL